MYACVLLAERHVGLAEGLRNLLKSMFEAVVMVGDEASLMETTRRLKPALVVVDLGLGRGGGLAMLQHLRAIDPALKLVVISGHAADTVRQKVLECGADRFVLRSEMATHLLTALDEVMSGRAPTSV